MDALDAIKTRRSIRKFQEKPVTNELIKKILEAAMMAPSAGNAQPWQFVVVQDKTVLNTVAQINPYAAMAQKAPMGILVCGDLSLERYPGFWVQDCSAAMQNLLLAVHDLGLGAVWTGIYPVEDRVQSFTHLFQLPENVIPLGFTVIGWPDQQPTSKNRFKEDRVHYEIYSKEMAN